jgi:HlyD family secretion protein
VEINQRVKVKLEAYPFQRYGMLDGQVKLITFDATDKAADAQSESKSDPAAKLSYRALIALNANQLEVQGLRYKLTPGMQVAAEIHLGTRSVFEYLLSPIQKTAHDAWRER